MAELPYIVYCRCAYSKEVPAEVKDRVLAGLAEAGAAFQAVPDLCELAARRDPALARWAGREDLRVVACRALVERDRRGRMLEGRPQLVAEVTHSRSPLGALADERAPFDVVLHGRDPQTVHLGDLTQYEQYRDCRDR